MGKRKRCSSSPVIKLTGLSSSDSDVAPAEMEMKGLSSSDSEAALSEFEMNSDSEAALSEFEMKGLSSSDSEAALSEFEMKGLSSSDSEAALSEFEMKGWTSSDSDVAIGGIEMKGWTSSESDDDVSPPRKQVKSVGCSGNDGKQPGVSEDELSGQLLGDREKVQSFGTTASGGDEQAVQRAKNVSHSASPDMKQSGCKEFDVKKLAEIFEIQGNEAMQSKLYPAAIEFYNVAIALGGDNAIYYCNRAAAYIQTCQYAEAILDCQKSIAIDPNYSKAHTRLGYIYFVQGIGALENGYRIATLLDPTNKFERENVREAEHILWQQREESGQGSAMGLSDTNPGELYADIIADISFLVALRQKTNNSNGN